MMYIDRFFLVLSVVFNFLKLNPSIVLDSKSQKKYFETSPSEALEGAAGQLDFHGG